MLDTYIIERIRRERESRESSRIPLHIENSIPLRSPRRDHDRSEDEHREEGEEQSERGVAIIDFTI